MDNNCVPHYWIDCIMRTIFLITDINDKQILIDPSNIINSYVSSWYSYEVIGLANGKTIKAAKTSEIEISFDLSLFHQCYSI